jgi:hypothetical protein
VRRVGLGPARAAIICLKDKCACRNDVVHGKTGILKELLRFALFNS